MGRLKLTPEKLAQLARAPLIQSPHSLTPTPQSNSHSLTTPRVGVSAEGIRAIAQQEEPLGRLLSRTEVAEGLELRRITCALPFADRWITQETPFDLSAVSGQLTSAACLTVKARLVARRAAAAVDRHSSPALTPRHRTTSHRTARRRPLCSVLPQRRWACCWSFSSPGRTPCRRSPPLPSAAATARA